MDTKENRNITGTDHQEEPHIVSYRENFSTWLALILLTVMTVGISVFGAKLVTLGVITAMVIASVKALTVAYNFMHLKYDKKIFGRMFFIVVGLFVVFMILLTVDYLNRT